MTKEPRRPGEIPTMMSTEGLGPRRKRTWDFNNTICTSCVQGARSLTSSQLSLSTVTLTRRSKGTTRILRSTPQPLHLSARKIDHKRFPSLTFKTNLRLTATNYSKSLRRQLSASFCSCSALGLGRSSPTRSATAASHLSRLLPELCLEK